MLRAIRVKIWQQLPNYRKPASFLVRESFPLPPYSSVIGMVHAACDFKEYHPMKVSVQGRYASEVSDLGRMYNFGIKYDPTRHQYKVKNEKGDYDGINWGVKSAHLLTDVELVLHIFPENEADFDVILNGLKTPIIYLSLGRHEDIVRVDAVDAVDLDVLDEYDDLPSCQYDMYVPLDLLGEKRKGTIYNINKVFVIDEKTKIRTWVKTVKVQHIAKGDIFGVKGAYIDREMNLPVCFA